MNYPFDNFPEKASDWREAQLAVSQGIAEFRNILDECNKQKGDGPDQILFRIRTYAVFGIKHLGGEL